MADPEDAFTRFALAIEYFKVGDIATSEKEFVELLRKHPDYSGAYYHYGKLAQEQGRLDAAAKLYTDGIDVSRKINDLHSLREMQQALHEVIELKDENDL